MHESMYPVSNLLWLARGKDSVMLTLLLFYSLLKPELEATLLPVEQHGPFWAVSLSLPS